MATETRTEEQLIAQYIEQPPNKWGRENAVLVEDAYPVWAIIGGLIGLNWDVERTADEYLISEDQVRAAIGYYRRNKGFIDTRLAPNLSNATVPDRIPENL